MARKRVSPNRMELMRLKKQLTTARRGHRLLKDKRDGLMRTFMTKVAHTVKLRRRVDRLLRDATSAMAMAEAVMGEGRLGEALLLNARPLSVKVEQENVMSVQIPRFEIDYEDRHRSDRFPYGLASTTAELDLAIEALQDALPSMLELASAEKEIQLLSSEIERTRRRVNSLEHVMIPEYEEQIRDISLKMDENERANLTRLMKVKDMIIEETQAKNRQRMNEVAEESRRKRAESTPPSAV